MSRQTSPAHLLRDGSRSDGFVRSWEEQHLDLAVEALALWDPWRALFTHEELTEAQRRLMERDMLQSVLIMPTSTAIQERSPIRAVETNRRKTRIWPSP